MDKNCGTAKKTVRSVNMRFVSYLGLIVCILAVKKQAFVTSDTIGLCYNSIDVFMNVSNIHDEFFAESFVYSSLHVTSVRKVSCLHHKRSVMVLMLLISGDINPVPGPTIDHPFTREEFKQNLSARGFKMVHQNIRWLVHHLLIHFINTHKEIDLLSLSDTHLSSDTSSDSLLLGGYTFLGKCRLTGIGGDVGIYIRNNISFKRRCLISKTTYFKAYV